MIGYFRRRIKDAAEAEDLAQEVFLRMLRRGNVLGLDDVRAYLFETASSVLVDRARRGAVRHRSKHDSFDPQTHAGETFPSERVFLGREALNRASVALLELPERTWTIFVLRRLQGMRYADVAKCNKSTDTSFNNAAMGLQNHSGGPYVPSDVVAIVDARQLNYGRERIQGADLGLNYTYQTSHGELKTFLNGTYIELRQQLTPESPPVELAGTSYSPPHFRARSGATWVIGGLSTTAYVNYMSHEVDTYQPSLPEVSSWTTIDAQIAYVVPKLGRVSGTRISLSVQNLFDRAPPYVPTLYLTGLNYDPVNASPLGRYITLQASVPVSW